MRWVFFALLGANVLLFSWHMLFPQQDDARPPAAVTPSQPDGSVPTLHLLQDEGATLSRGGEGIASGKGAAGGKSTTSGEGAAAAPVSADLAAQESVKPLCTFVGPFDESAKADQLVERLRATRVEGEIVNLEIPAGPGYWVYLPPLPSRRDALRRLSELQAQGVDSYVIPRGELANGISLGMFSKEGLATARISDMEALGISPKLEIIERSFQELWVSIPAVQARNLGEQAWERLLEVQKNAERKQNFCLHVASQDNFH